MSLCLIVILLALVSTTSADDARPNVVMLLADDLGYADLSCFDSPEVKTPALDGLAAEGAKFTHFYAGSAVCSPSRAGLLTGRFPVRAGVYSWIHTSHNMHLRVEETTIAEVLKQAGYDTAHVGKWHLSYDLEEGSGPNPDPGDHGFDYWLATGNNAEPSHRNPNNFVRNGKALGEVPGYSCQIVADEAINWLKGRSEPSRPFFLNVWFHEPHRKVAAPEELAARHAGTRDPHYYGCIENMDAAVARLLETLEELGVSENTAVIFTSDNGSYMKGSAGPLKGRKTQLWEGGIRVPGIIRWPGHVSPGTVIDEPAGIVDLLPTICGIAGVAAPTDRTLDGVSLLPLLTTAGPIERMKPLYWFYSPSRPVCVTREGDWCLIADPDIDLPRTNMFREEYIGPIKEAELVNVRLYNLRTDPGQTTNLAEQEPQRLEAMRQRMRDVHRDVMDEAFDWHLQSAN
ncbi:sulfatase [Maioricimonas sp. JC845]|uniref:sulfatase n=1 Tax=Maioricimonas sp. JC845 TaxID=3232138 RepID=UPI00345A9DB0